MDLVLVFVGANEVEDAIRQTAAAGASAAVVYASGFAETGPEGLALQQRLAAVARETGVRVLGPNCQGYLYVPHAVFATFSAAADPRQRDHLHRARAAPSVVRCSISPPAWQGSRGMGEHHNQADLDVVEVSTEFWPRSRRGWEVPE